MHLRTCVSPSGHFTYGIHKPTFDVENFRENSAIVSLGSFSDGKPCENHINFPDDTVKVPEAEWIYEIPNVFPFRGTTYISKSWAEEKAKDPSSIGLPEPSALSFLEVLNEWGGKDKLTDEQIDLLFSMLPEPILLTLASTSTDPNDLTRLAELSCEFIHHTENKRPKGLVYKQNKAGKRRAVFKNKTLFEVVANNIHLPDDYKEVMVLKPGVQGGSEIVGEYCDEKEESHVFEYLRSNSYIPWGHYAANMADDSIRYQIKDLSMADMTGMRHLYYQRTYTRLAEELNIPLPGKRRALSITELEELRKSIYQVIQLKTKDTILSFNGSLWGWNFGFDYAPSKYRLHASHQQVHQQFALIPEKVPTWTGKNLEEGEKEYLPTYAGGDQIASFIKVYQEQTGKEFFDRYIKAIKTNQRMDENNTGENSLIVYEDENVVLFVPKAQTSQWELNLMTLNPVGNVIEADIEVRKSLDEAMLLAIKVLGALGAKMVTIFEYSKRFDSQDTDQRLIYAFLPRLPESPGAFSEAQLRWINGHYPEDFAYACRSKM